MAELKCVVVTPEATVVDRPTTFVALPLFDGELGVAPGHSPTIGRLGSGELRIHGSGGVDRYYVEGGFVEILGSTISVLTNRAIPADQLDVTQAETALDEARQRPANTPELMAIRDRNVDQSRAQLRVARRTAK